MRQRTIGVLVVVTLRLMLSAAQAEAKPWSVDVPGDWFAFTLPIIKSQVAKMRNMRGVKTFEVFSYSAGAGAVLFIMVGVADPEQSSVTYDDIVEFDRDWRQRELSNTTFREVSYSSELVDGQVVTHSDDTFSEGGFRNLRLIALDGEGLLHVLHVGCFSPNGAFELCARVQQSARLMPPDARSLGGGYRNIVIGIAIAAVVLLIFFATRKRETPVVSVRDTEPSSSPELDHRYVPSRPHRSSRMPSSIPLDVEVGEVVRSQVETAQQGTKISYATSVIELSPSGIAATREDGLHRNVAWSDLVGIVVRRLPTAPPYAGATVVDLISQPGATLRLVPWTQITGVEIFGSVEERARRFAKMVSKRCPTARLDAATRTFVDGTDSAPQLPDAETLAEHDRRLA